MPDDHRADDDRIAQRVIDLLLAVVQRARAQGDLPVGQVDLVAALGFLLKRDQAFRSRFHGRIGCRKRIHKVEPRLLEGAHIPAKERKDIGLVGRKHLEPAQQNAKGGQPEDAHRHQQTAGKPIGMGQEDRVRHGAVTGCQTADGQHHQRHGDDQLRQSDHHHLHSARVCRHFFRGRLAMHAYFVLSFHHRAHSFEMMISI